uniref:Uncharacterized protein n=1 Tax=Anguilla anguilla TaxID=7936 RepID=A0A0E9V0V3_ANGAN
MRKVSPKEAGNSQKEAGPEGPSAELCGDALLGDSEAESLDEEL